MCRPSCVVRHVSSVMRPPSCIVNFFESLLLPRPIDSKLEGSIWVTCRSKQLKSFRSDIQGGRHGDYLKNLFCASFPKPERPIVSKLYRNYQAKLQIKISEIVQPEILSGRHGGYLENLFRSSSESIGNKDGRHDPISKIYFALLLLNPKVS